MDPYFTKDNMDCDDTISTLYHYTMSAIHTLMRRLYNSPQFHLYLSPSFLMASMKT
jgi:hypothetical protein